MLDHEFGSYVHSSSPPPGHRRLEELKKPEVFSMLIPMLGFMKDLRFSFRFSFVFVVISIF